MTVVAMSQSELTRFDILQRVERGELRVSDAAASLSLCPRQIYRLLGRLRTDGAAGLVSRKRGRPSNRRFSDAFRDQVVGIVRERKVEPERTLARRSHITTVVHLGCKCLEHDVKRKTRTWVNVGARPVTIG